jgi:hypothetical protein
MLEDTDELVEGRLSDRLNRQDEFVVWWLPRGQTSPRSQTCTYLKGALAGAFALINIHHVAEVWIESNGTRILNDEQIRARNKESAA